MKTRYTISAAMLLAAFTAASAQIGTTYMNVQVGENEYKSFEVTPDLKVTWDSEKQETEVSKPAVSNGSATDIAEMKATLTGKITDDGNGEITECGFYWGTTDNPSFKVSCDAASDTLVYTLKGLKGNVKYYYRTFARNSKGETCGEVQSFKTKGLTQSSPAGTIGILEGIEAIVVDLPTVPASEQKEGWPNWNGSTTGTTYAAKKVAIATMNYGATSIDEAPVVMECTLLLRT
ncbi:MAG: fibronectin type III domain-containing protein [Bacteroidaceae bacterium]|nr:fibronectin type III domain-containing protein [Bacteroidaceae bacterium]